MCFAVFSLLCCCLLHASRSPSEETSLLLLIYTWLCGAEQGCSDPIYPLPLPKASSRENQSFCPFLGNHALCFLFCVPSVLETSVMFVSSLGKLKDNTYFILDSYLYRNELWHQRDSHHRCKLHHNALYGLFSSPASQSKKSNMISFQLLL